MLNKPRQGSCATRQSHASAGHHSQQGQVPLHSKGVLSIGGIHFFQQIHQDTNNTGLCCNTIVVTSLGHAQQGEQKSGRLVFTAATTSTPLGSTGGHCRDGSKWNN